MSGDVPYWMVIGLGVVCFWQVAGALFAIRLVIDRWNTKRERVQQAELEVAAALRKIEQEPRE